MQKTKHVSGRARSLERAQRPRESAGRPGREEPKRERQKPRESTTGLERAPEAQGERRPRGRKEMKGL